MKKFVAMMILFVLVTVQNAFAYELPDWAKATNPIEVSGEDYGFGGDCVVYSQRIESCCGIDQITEYYTVIYQDHEDTWLVVYKGVDGVEEYDRIDMKISNGKEFWKDYLEEMLFKYRKTEW